MSPAREATAAKGKLLCSGDTPAEGGGISLARPKRSWDVVEFRGVNETDLYVVRVSKPGMSVANPCWRCMRWCYWSGARRNFTGVQCWVGSGC